MKKNDIILLVVGVILIVLALFIGGSNSKDEEVTPPSTEVGLQNITYKQYEYLLEQGEKFVVFLGATGCSWCEKFTPVMKEVAEENNITVYYLDIAKISSKQHTKLAQSSEWLSSNSWGTPTTVILSKEETFDVLEGYNEKDATITFLKENGLISE